MKTVTSIFTSILLCVLITASSFAISNIERLELKDIYLQQRAEQFVEQKTNNNNAVMFRTADQDVTQLPYYNYNGIQDLVEAKLAWYDAQTANVTYSNKAVTTYSNPEQYPFYQYQGLQDLEEARKAYGRDHFPQTQRVSGPKGNAPEAPCPNDNTQFGSNALICNGAPTELTTGIFGGEYRLITSVISGVEYQFETCGDSDFDTEITVYDDVTGALLASNDDFCGLQSQVIFTTTTSNDLRVLVDQFPCTSNTTNMTLFGQCEPPPPPVNDLCVDAIQMVCGETVSGTTLGATFDGAPFCGTSNTAPGVWYTFEAGPGPVTLTTCGGPFDYDTKISVYTDGCGTLTCIDGNDDNCVGGASGLLSTVEFEAVGGTYLVLVHGFVSLTGDFELTLNCTEPCELSMNCAPDVSVSNDEGECGAVVLLTPPEILCCGAGGGGGGGEPQSLEICIWDELGGNCAAFTGDLCNDGFNFGIPPQFNIFPDPLFGGPPSSIDFHIYWTCDPGNWDFLLNGGLIGTTGAQTSGECQCIPTSTYPQTFNIVSAAIAANWVSGGNNTLTVVDLSGGISALGAYSATLNWNPVNGGNNDKIQTTVQSVEEKEAALAKINPSQYEYYNYDGIEDMEEAKIAWAADHPELYVNSSTTSSRGGQVNDFCVDALPIPCGTTQVFGSTVGAINDIAPFCGTSDGTGGGVWYTVLGNGQNINITTCAAGSNYDTKIRVYDGSCGALNCVTGNDDDACSFSFLRSRVDWNSIAGTTYYVLVHGFSSAEGDFELEITGNDCCILTNDAPASNYYPVGSTTVTWTLTHENGNSTTCEQTVVVNDTEPPSITCAPDQLLIPIDEGACGAQVTVVGPIVADNCCIVSGTSTGTGGSGAIPDGIGGCNDAAGTVLEDIITISGGGTSVSNVSIELDIEHTWVGDLVIDLTSSDGTTLRVLETVSNPNPVGNGSGCGCGDNLVSGNPISFFDGSANDAATVEATCGSTVWSITEGDPVDPFGGFIGESVNGDWKLSIRDYSGADVGFLFGWSITIDYGSPKTGGSQTITKTNTLLEGAEKALAKLRIMQSASKSSEEKMMRGMANEERLAYNQQF